MSHLWKENMIDAPIKKSVFLPNSCNLYAGSGFGFLFVLGLVFFFSFFLFFCVEMEFILSVLVSLVSSAHSLVAFEYSD